MSNIVPVKDLDHYLSDPFNQGIYEDLEDIGLDPLEFFGFFYLLVGLIEQGKPSQVIEALDAQGWQGGLRLYILHRIQGRLRDAVGRVAGWTVNDAHEDSLFIIDKEYKQVAEQFQPDIFPSDPENSSSDRARRAVAIGNMTTHLLGGMLKRTIVEAKQRAEAEQAIELRARQSERERLEAIISETVQAAIAAQTIKKNPEHTLNRQVLALGFMLKHLGVQNIDKSDQARFVEFLVGKTYKDIYDNLRELEDRVLHRKGQDARYVIAMFKELGLNDIAQDIEELLSKSNL